MQKSSSHFVTRSTLQRAVQLLILCVLLCVLMTSLLLFSGYPNSHGASGSMSSIGEIATTHTVPEQQHTSDPSLEQLPEASSHVTAGWNLSKGHNISYRDYYPEPAHRPNVCKHTQSSARKKLEGEQYIPFIGTSAIRDSQLLLLRLFYSMDYPVKHFIIVIGKNTLESPTALGYAVRHLLGYGFNVVVLTCEELPSVAESWNAVFQQFSGEPWGVYAATDTAWEPGSLKHLSSHFWGASKNGSVDVGLMTWVNMPDKSGGEFNTFAMTRQATLRYGLFDENLYPAYFEDRDFDMRSARMDPPLSVKQLSDVWLVHGTRQDAGYKSGISLANDPQDPGSAKMNALAVPRFLVNANYMYRKWGCQGEKDQQFAPWGSCRYKTPFNKPVGVWYWHTSKQQRLHDLDLKVVRNGQPHLAEISTGKAVFYFPADYYGWEGYKEPRGSCRLSGKLGLIRPANNTSGSVTCI